MPEVQRSPEARADLLQTWLYVAERNPRAADQLLDLIDAIDAGYWRRCPGWGGRDRSCGPIWDLPGRPVPDPLPPDGRSGHRGSSASCAAAATRQPVRGRAGGKLHPAAAMAHICGIPVAIKAPQGDRVFRRWIMRLSLDSPVHRYPCRCWRRADFSGDK